MQWRRVVQRCVHVGVLALLVPIVMPVSVGAAPLPAVNADVGSSLAVKNVGAITVAPTPTVLVNNATYGWYNAALGTVLDGTSPLFPLANLASGDPAIVPAPEPDLTAAATILGGWLGPDPLSLNANWSGPQPIPYSWATNTETAIVYAVDAGPTGIVNLRGDFGVDNGLFVWVNGRYTFGVVAPGGTGRFEYGDIALGDLPPGRNYIQVLREDHGGQTGYEVQVRFTITGTPAPAVAFDPPQLTFGAQQVDTTSAPQAVKLTSSGNVALTIGNIYTSGNFSRVHDCPSRLEPQMSCTIQVAFTARVGGDRTGTLYITSNAAGSPHVVSLRGEIVESKPVLVFVHGIRADYTKPGFDDLLQPLMEEFPGSVKLFQHYQDIGDYDPRSKKCVGVREPILPAPELGMPVNPRSISPDYCDTNGDLGLSAILLGQDVRRYFHESGGRKVIIVAHSMGGAIARGFLAHSRAANDGIASGMVDRVIFLQSAHDGSYLAPFAPKQLGSLIVAEALSEITKAGLNPARPAPRQLAPRSDWYTWVNPSAAHLPNLPYYNVYGDITVAKRKCSFSQLRCTDQKVQSWGDLVMLPGTDSPFDLPENGGARFLRGQPGEQNWQWGLPRQIIWLALDPTEMTVAEELGAAPEAHTNFGGRMSDIMVEDCKTRARIPLERALLNVIRGSFEGRPYRCQP